MIVPLPSSDSLHTFLMGIYFNICNYNFLNNLHEHLLIIIYLIVIVITSKEPVCPRVELILKIIIILLIIFLGFIKSKPC